MNRWKQYGLALGFCCCFLSSARGQTKADSISLTAPKFLIRNQKGQILLVFDASRQAWEVPGVQYAGPITFQQLAREVAKEYGISYKAFKLAGLFTYHTPTRYRTTVRPYFTLRFTGFSAGKGFPKEPRLQWVDPSQIPQLVLYPAAVLIIAKLIQEPNTVWGGAFEEYGYTNPLRDPSVVKFRIIEPFYKLN